jgi:hypothetical protein
MMMTMMMMMMIDCRNYVLDDSFHHIAADKLFVRAERRAVKLPFAGLRGSRRYRVYHMASRLR